jgi:LacI family transcriptional regulator, galactose operon repressor
MTSLSDVAALAGVSVATASRVLAFSSHPVAPSTRQRVLDASQALDFEPNLLARGLVGQRTQTVGVLVHDVMDEYFSEIARGIEDEAYARGYFVFICNSDRDPVKELYYLRKLRAMRVDAILFTAGGINDAEHQREAQRQVSQIEAAGGVVIRLAPHPDHRPDVGYSNIKALRLAVDHLYELGHRTIGFLSGPPQIATSTERLAAFRRALRHHHLDPDVAPVFDGDFTRPGGERAAYEFLTAGLPATGVVGANDQMVIGFVRGLRTAGVTVPDDVSVVGYDDVAPCILVEPPITTVHVPLYELGTRGMRLALDLLAGAPRPRRTELPVALMVRATTGPPRTRRPSMTRRTSP